MKKTVVKKVAAVAVSGGLSQLSRKCYNILLAEAMPSMKEAIIHKIGALDLIERLGIKTRNWAHLTQALEALQNTKINHDTLKVDGTGAWFRANLVSEVAIVGGVIEWEYSSKIRNLLATGKLVIGDQTIVIPYIIVDLTQNFSCKHAGALYEMCLHWLPKNKNYADSPWFSIDDLNTLFGGESELKYTRYPDLNRDIISKAIKEINSKEDLPFSVKSETKNLGRKIAFAKFKVTRKKHIIVEPDFVADIENPILSITAMLTVSGLHKKTISAFVKKSEQHDRLSELAEKVAEVCERYKSKSPLEEKIKAVTGTLNKHIEKWGKAPLLPGMSPEPLKGTTKTVDTDQIRQCMKSKHGACETRKTGSARVAMCQDCIDLYPPED
jgi:plasmid replication initiation protein